MADKRAGISLGLEHMQWASIAWQPEAWTAARRAGSAHDGRADGRVVVLLDVVVACCAVVKGRMRAKRALMGFGRRIGCDSSVGVEVGVEVGCGSCGIA